MEDKVLTTFNIGGIHIRSLARQKTIEIFEISADASHGPGLHIHKNMEESFYILNGSVTFHINGKNHLLTKGECVSVPRNTPHSWKTAEANTKMLLIFTPSQNQIDYFAALERLNLQGSSWNEAISLLADTFDNIPINGTPL